MGSRNRARAGVLAVRREGVADSRVYFKAYRDHEED